MSRIGLFVLVALLGVSSARAADMSAEALFVTKVQPLLKEKCLACHGDDTKKIKGKFDMRTRAGLLKGGESGEAALHPGDPERSPIFVAVTWRTEDLQMPPKENDRLTAEQIDVLRRWIADGAPWLDADAAKKVQQAEWSNAANADGLIVKTSGGLSDQWTYRRYQPEDLWAFQPIRKIDPPATTVKTTQPIDAFIEAKIEEHGLTASGPTDKLTLLRRATYDLTGLPPTPQEVADFLADGSPKALEKVIDRLLASPRYGERMAQHWLDVVRYADTNGGANDFERPSAWRYRDYVVRAFNADKPYDRFVTEQLAGDEADPKNPESAIATGFIRMGPWEHTGMSVAAETRQQFLDDITNAVGQVFLGQGLGCAKCHDHKFDPIPTRDYYSIMAVFAPVQFAEKSLPFLPVENHDGFDAGRQRVQKLLAETRATDAAIKRKSTEAARAWLKERGYDPDLAERGKAKRKGANVGYADIPKDMRPPRNIGLSNTDLGVQKVLNKREDYLVRMLERYEPLAYTLYDGPPRDKPYASTVPRNPIPDDLSGEPEQVHILTGGSIQAPAALVTPGVLTAVPGALDIKVPDSLDGRRLALARWITDPKNTLTARVMVNRLWQMHFGHGLVATPNNFGKMGKHPSHPELLDWLAATFIESGWSIKQMHRLIMTTAAYQRSGEHADMDKLREKDPNNELLAYFPPRRLTAEELRDSMLAASGELDLTMGGPGVFPEINMEAALQPRHIMGSVAMAYQPSPTPSQRNRRTVYAFRYRGLPDPMLEVFNQPNAEMSCERRDSTTVTPQVFSLFNGQSSYDRALSLAHRVASSSGDRREQVAMAYRAVLGRTASEQEIDLAVKHVDTMTKMHTAARPVAVPPPTVVKRSMIEEMTGVAFEWDEPLDIYASGYVADLKPWDVAPEVRGLAELCLVLMNANEFVYVY